MQVVNLGPFKHSISVGCIQKLQGCRCKKDETHPDVIHGPFLATWNWLPSARHFAFKDFTSSLSQVSSVDIATCYRLDGLGSLPVCARFFSTAS
jgi:hypothetical protein